MEFVVLCSQSQLQFMDWKRAVIEEFQTDSIFIMDALCICILEDMEMRFYCMPSWIGWFYSPQKTPLRAHDKH